ncbi:MAG: beta-propeller fold lactonase family protein [Acidobacteriota bacterium]
MKGQLTPRRVTIVALVATLLAGAFGLVLAAPAAADTLIVANKAEATVSLVDLESGEVKATLPTGDGPHEVAVSPDGRRAVIADYGTGEAPGSTLTLIDVPGARVLSTISLGEYRRPHGLAWVHDDALFVTAEARKALLRVDPGAGKVVSSYETGQEVSHMVAVTPDASRAFVANIGSGTVTALDLETGEKLADVATGDGAEGIAVTPDGSRVWVTNRAADTVSVIDAASLKVVGTVELGSFPIRAEVTPDGAHVLVSNARSGSVAVIDQGSAEVLATVTIEVAASAEGERLLRFGESPVPIGIEIAPDGERAFVALANADQIVILDLEKRAVAGQLTAGKEPDGMAYSEREVQ